MELKRFYDKAFIHASSGGRIFPPNPSLKGLLSHPLLKEKRNTPHTILETGCGARSAFALEDNVNQEVLAVDFSMAAVNLAPDDDGEKGITYKVMDVTEEWNLGRRFDVVFDAHCFQCLTGETGRRRYLAEVRKHLNPGGRFFLESMVVTGQMEFPDDFLYLEEEQILLQQIKDEAIAVRFIPKPSTLEQELLDAGFILEYFKVFEDKKIIPHARRDAAYETDPSSLTAVFSISE